MARLASRKIQFPLWLFVTGLPLLMLLPSTALARTGTTLSSVVTDTDAVLHPKPDSFPGGGSVQVKEVRPASSQADTGKGGPMAKIAADLIVLYDAYVSYLAKGGGPAFKPNNPLLRVIDGRVIIDAVASGDVNALKSDLEALGMREAVAFGRIVSGQLPIRAISALAGLASLRFAQPAYASTRPGSLSPGPQQGPVPHPPATGEGVR